MFITCSTDLWPPDFPLGMSRRFPVWSCCLDMHENSSIKPKLQPSVFTEIKKYVASAGEKFSQITDPEHESSSPPESNNDNLKDTSFKAVRTSCLPCVL